MRLEAWGAARLVGIGYDAIDGGQAAGQAGNAVGRSRGHYATALVPKTGDYDAEWLDSRVVEEAKAHIDDRRCLGPRELQGRQQLRRRTTGFVLEHPHARHRDRPGVRNHRGGHSRAVAQGIAGFGLIDDLAASCHANTVGELEPIDDPRMAWIDTAVDQHDAGGGLSHAHLGVEHVDATVNLAVEFHRANLFQLVCVVDHEVATGAPDVDLRPIRGDARQALARAELDAELV